MDNVCHTLVGAALSRTGLGRRTALGGATLMIGANFPDIDAIAVPLGMSFEWRRGVTHGVLALVVLPLVLTGIMLVWDRFVRRRRGSDRTPADPRALLLLSAVSIATHPLLDWMNVYGVRWLMPFDGTWFYGDALFIIDPWIWGALAVGVAASRRRWKRGAEPDLARRPAIWSLGLVSVYIVAMFIVGARSEALARRALGELAAGDADRVMAAPVPVNPLRRQIVASVDGGARYRFGELHWRPGAHLEVSDFVLESGMGSPVAMHARTDERGEGFLQWARFPFVTTEGIGQDAAVWIGDARYSIDPSMSWAAVRLPAAPPPE